MLVPFINVLIVLIAIFNQEAVYQKTIKNMIKIENREYAN
jgi:biopolymer transport protein ExbD